MKTYREDSLTMENYRCPRGEEGYYHVVLEHRRFDQVSGERLSVPHIQKYSDKEWPQERDILKFNSNISIRVIHDPIEYAKRRKEKEAKELQAKIASARMQEEARIQEEARKEAEEKVNEQDGLEQMRYPKRGTKRERV